MKQLPIGYNCLKKGKEKMNEEYEYSFKVKDIEPFINYCENNNYDLVSEYEQIRTLYKNGGKIMARITKNTYKDSISEILNFKDDNITLYTFLICSC